MTTYKLDTDCLICIGARHRDVQNLAGMPRRKGGWAMQEGGDRARVRVPVGIAAGRAKGVYRNPKKFQIKAVKGLLSPFRSLPALHRHSLMLCFKRKLALWSNHYACEGAASVRRLQKVLANQLSVRHHGWTLSGSAAAATRCLPPTSCTALPGVTFPAPAVAKAPMVPRPDLDRNCPRHLLLISLAAGTDGPGRGLQQTRGR